MALDHQQVNNEIDGWRAVKVGKKPNELLETQHGERLGFGAKEQAIRDDKELEALGAKQRGQSQLMVWLSLL